jgi:hypothetical protein
MPDLSQWDSFYVIVGSAAGALIGLQFVVMTLLADSPSLAAPEAGAAFGSPTIVHFSVALFLSAIVRVPWPSMMIFSSVLDLMGLLGLIYMMIVVWRMTSQNSITPIWKIGHSMQGFLPWPMPCCWRRDWKNRRMPGPHCSAWARRR